MIRSNRREVALRGTGSLTTFSAEAEKAGAAIGTRASKGNRPLLEFFRTNGFLPREFLKDDLGIHLARTEGLTDAPSPLKMQATALSPTRRSSEWQGLLAA